MLTKSLSKSGKSMNFYIYRNFYLNLTKYKKEKKQKAFIKNKIFSSSTPNLSTEENEMSEEEGEPCNDNTTPKSQTLVREEEEISQNICDENTTESTAFHFPTVNSSALGVNDLALTTQKQQILLSQFLSMGASSGTNETVLKPTTPPKSGNNVSSAALALANTVNNNLFSPAQLHNGNNELISSQQFQVNFKIF